MGLFWLFWYCYDDRLADFLDVPNLGHVPFWYWLVILVVLGLADAD